MLLVVLAVFSLNIVAYASFPVTESSTEQLSALNEISPVSSDGPGWGIAALCCGVLGLLFPFLGIPAVIFGAKGLRKSGKGMAIAGLILGIIEVIWLLVLILLVGTFIMGGGFSDLQDDFENW